VVHVLMSAQWVLFLRVTFTLLMLTCVQSAALVQMYAQVRQSLKDKIADLL
jgi:hypothetical protein